MNYDVIVIGAGPTGCAAAKALADNGYSVLLAEKCKLPRYKSCSGQLITKTIDLVRLRFGEDVPASVTCAPSENKGMILTDQNGVSYTFEQDGLNVWRSSFDNWLAGIAAKAGVHVVDGTSATSCTQCCDSVEVTLKGNSIYTVTARYVIDCEGVVGTLKLKLTGCKTQYVTTYQTYNKGNIDLDQRYFYAYLQPELSEYDAWFNVKDGMLVLGTAVLNADKALLYHDRFIRYMEQNHGLHIDEQIKIDKWLMKRVHYGCDTNCGTGRVLFAGEVAGFLNPMGEGISSAIESGNAAAEAVMHHFDNADKVISEYYEYTSTLREYMKRQWNFISKMSDAFAEMKI